MNSKEEKLIQELCHERDWRVKELNIYTSIPHRYSNPLFININREYWKMCVPMIYAHWEGGFIFIVKTVCEYLNSKHISYSKINTDIAVLSLSKSMLSLSGNCNRESQKRFYDELIKKYNGNVQINTTEAITAKSNLNCKQIRCLLNDIGIDFEFIQPYYNLIEKLVAFRNKIAHGENSVVVHEEDIKAFSDGIILLFDVIILRIQKYITDKEFMRKKGCDGNR